MNEQGWYVRLPKSYNRLVFSIAKLALVDHKMKPIVASSLVGSGEVYGHDGLIRTYDPWFTINFAPVCMRYSDHTDRDHQGVGTRGGNFSHPVSSGFGVLFS